MSDEKHAWLRKVLLLFYVIYMIVPFRVHALLGFIVIKAPQQAALFGTIFPVFSYIDLAAFVVALLVVPFGFLYQNRIFVVYCLACFGAMSFAAMRFPFFSLEYFGAGIIVVIREVIPIVIVHRLLKFNVPYQWILSPFLLAMVAGIVMHLAGAQNSAFSPDDYGRLNPPGLEVTSAGHIGVALLLLGYTAFKGWPRILYMTGGIMGAVAAGGRIPFVLITCWSIWQIARVYSLRQIISRIIFIGGVIALFFVALKFISIPVLNRFISPPQVAESAQNEEKNLASSIFPTNFSILQDPNVMGRLAGWSSGLMTLKEEMGYPLGTDWGVQNKLVDYGWPSHTHNTYIQMLLCWGGFAIFPLLVGVQCWRGLRKNKYKSSIWGDIIVFLMIGWFFDYYLCVVNASVFYFIIWLIWGMEKTEPRKCMINE